MFNKYQLTEVKNKGNAQITYIWHPGIIPEDIPVQQVYGFCSTSDNFVALVKEKDDDRFTPPGGAVEDNETPLEALHREFLEEAQCVPEDVQLLGSLEVINPSATEKIQKHNLQVRYVCRVGTCDTFEPMRDGETEQRIFVFYKDLPKYVGFFSKYTSGKIQYEMYKDFLEGKLKL